MKRFTVLTTILVLVLALSVAGCKRTKYETAKEKAPADAPAYTVAPELNGGTTEIK
jgi:hypothetical protein